MKLRVARGSHAGITHYDVFEIKQTPGMTVLDALFYIQDHLDPSISFRYSCRGAVCGSCGMLIDKVPMLACRTQLQSIKMSESNLKLFEALADNSEIEWDRENEILIEPLPNFALLKDLVVDMDKFYKTLEIMKLWADPVEGEKPRLQSPVERKLIDRYVNCIMCALCFGSCPINAEKEEYLGPAALAKSYRFFKDSRSTNPSRYIDAASVPEGAALCDLIMNCVKVCPKGVAPGAAIRKIKQAVDQSH